MDRRYKMRSSNNQRGAGEHTRRDRHTRNSLGVEGKLNYMDDPKLKDKDPGAFKMYSVPLAMP
jgi:hypothetical protein